MTQRRRILLLAPFAPRLDAVHGGGRTIANLIAALAATHDLHVLCVRAAADPPVDPALIAAGVRADEFVRDGAPSATSARWQRKLRSLRRAAAGLPAWASHCRLPELEERLRELVREWRPDVVQFEFHVMGQYAEISPRGQAARVLTQHEPGTPAARERLAASAGFARAVALVDFVSWRRYEPRMLRQMDAIVAFSQRDVRTTSAAVPDARIERITPGIDTHRPPSDPRGTGAMVLFVGNYAHPPNVDAAVRLARDILPRIREQAPEVQLVLAGFAPPPGVQALANVAVAVPGGLPSIEPLLDAAAVVAAPIRRGGGVRIKVLEALAAGKAIVASRTALEGIDVVDGEHALIADDDQTFADAVVRLVHDPEQRARLGTAARRWAEASAGWAETARRYGALYASLESSRR